MRAELLHVVTCVANPVRWTSRIKLYRQFEAHMLASGVNLTVVECAYGDRPYECAGTPGVRHVGVQAHTMVWSKENLLNLGVTRLPDDWSYVAFIDADVMFRNPNWAADTVHALQLYPAVQPWTHCYDLGPNEEHMECHRSLASLWRAGMPIEQGPNAKGAGYQFGHPGYGWAFRRRTLNDVSGLIETAALGAADHHMAMAMIGRVQDSVPADLTEGYKRPLFTWQGAAEHAIHGNIAAVHGTIEHGFHGTKGKRKYVDRWEILRRNAFDPATDLKRNVWGVIELAGNKPQLRDDIDRYFRSRDEDATTLG
jgi:hypothetical protein